MARAWKLHDNVNTDEIIPGRYNVTTDRASLARHCLCEVRPDFPDGVRPGDTVVVGRNFVCGSSREHDPVAILARGVQAGIAPSFARLFYRNAANIRLPLLTTAVAARILQAVAPELHAHGGTISNLTRNETYQFEPLPPFVAGIARAGGILEYIRHHGWEGVT